MNHTISVSPIIRLVRPYQWVKNLFVFMALFFGGRMLDTEYWLPVTMAAICFCFCSSAIYCLNDIIDAPADRLDPVKSRRPVASGAISVAEAAATGCVMAAAGLGLSIIFLTAGATVILLVYLALNVAYCLKIKNWPLIDVIVVALGFVLRVVIGGVVAGIWISQWIVIMVFLLSLFMALAKRRHEVVLVLTREKERGRHSIDGYDIRFLDMALSLLGAVTVIGYIIYTLQPRTIAQFHTEYLYVTALPVIIGILRYMQLTVVGNATGDPSKVALTDIPLRISVIVWVLLFVAIIYLF
ncbi:MAG: decaprenyl-phosphate phosphoribosyltransferase [Duncaniella sp.]|nr:decaprenyl-phosphate phosphoribosyltransferase [Duncaniella sp.]